MKNNLLSEIKHIKNLMGLNEVDNKSCEDQLEKAGYIVYNKTEQKSMDVGCENDKKIKCVKKWMDDNGIDKSNYRIAKYRGYCYISVFSTTTVNIDGKDLRKRVYTFWDNGDVTYIRSFDVEQVDTSDSSIKYSQVQFKGKFECDGTVIKMVGMRYIGVYKVGNTSDLIGTDKVPGTYMVKKADGTDDGEILTYLQTNFNLDATTLTT